MSDARQTTPAEAGVTGWRSLLEFLPLLLQLALAVAVVRLYAIEGPAFERIFVLAAVGFAFNLVLPVALRLRFFVVLSLVGVVVTLGPADAAWLFAVGLVLIGLCHLPASLAVRVAAVVLVAAALAVARAGWLGVPWTGAVWPVVGSIFMFRLALYLHAMSLGRQKPPTGFWPTVAYFFMLPNVVFPLFPVVDYQTFVRTYYDRAHKEIYEQGLVWITRGLVHLLLYRLVYQRFLPDPVDVATLGDLAQLMLSTFLLYLRVSGQFHLIVGILHLFGFRLPETHKLYYLAQGFTELWRRINIYWTDFMTKLVFYPTYFRVKRLGPERALIVSTIVVFVTTWALHSYQWFWLRGGFPITLQDTLFWGILGALVTFGVLRELSAPKKVVAAAGGWDGSRAIRTAATFLAFCFLWSLWSTESVSQWLWTLTLVGNVDTKGVVLIAGVVTIVAALGGRDWKSWSPASTWAPVALRPATRTTLTLLMLVVLGLPAFRNAPPMLADLMAAVHASGLNARDTATQHRGYYEQLDVRSAPVALAANVAARSEGWTEIVDLGIVRDRKDLLLLDLEPSRSVDWNGKPFSTNRWGMRDQDYGESKGPGIYRIALLGPSHVMGDNVPDGQTFEALVERRLNAELTSGGTCHFEVLNFAMPGYSVLQDLAILEDRVFAFAPDMVLITRHTSERALIERSLERLLRYDVAVPHDALAALLRDAGLDALHRGSVPVPSALGRSLARSLGLDVRMPDSELAARVRRMSDEAAIWAYRSIAEQTRAHGAVPAILALNVVSAPTAADFPDGASLDPLQLPEVNLFDVYPVDRLQELQVAPWDDHPNQEGHRLIAERLYPELTALLQSVSTSPSIPRERRVAPCPTSTTR